MQASFIILLFVSVCCAEWNYDVTQVEASICSPLSTEGGKCIECIADNGQYLYRTLHLHDNGYVSYHNFSGSYCSGSFTEISAEKGACNTAAPSCEIFYEANFVAFELSVRTFSPLSVRFLKEYYGPTTIFELSATEVIAHSPNECKGIWFSAGGQHFRVIKILSSTQYATTLGVMDIGQQYTINEFTFTLSKITSLTPPSSTPPKIAATVTLRPFYEISVSPDAPDDFMIRCSNSGHFTWAVFLKDMEDLSYVNLGFEPAYNVTDISIFPPYDGDDDGTLVYRFAERSTFHTALCYYELSDTFGNGSVFECGIGEFSGFFSFSFSDLFSWSGFDFSFDEEQQQIKQVPTADNMAFQLF